MPRRSRLMLPGIPLHLVQRGNNRTACFFSDEDRSFYLFHLDRLLRKSGCDLHAYCLMTNHVHMLLTADSADGCARLMKGMGQLHTQYVNRTYARSGTLWEGRFRSCLVESEDYVLACYRYIELNPVRAGLCMHPDEHPWSSFGSNGAGRYDSRITPHEEYLRLGRSRDERTRAYRQLLDEQMPTERLHEIREATDGNIVLGREPFQRQIAAMLGKRTTHGHAGRPPRNPANDAGQLELLALKKNVVCP
jgi:putative transposase